MSYLLIDVSDYMQSDYAVVKRVMEKYQKPLFLFQKWNELYQNTLVLIPTYSFITFRQSSLWGLNPQEGVKSDTKTDGIFM